MKKVTLTFIVSDDVADNVRNYFVWDDKPSAAAFLDKNCEESDYEIEEYEG